MSRHHRQGLGVGDDVSAADQPATEAAMPTTRVSASGTNSGELGSTLRRPGVHVLAAEPLRERFHAASPPDCVPATVNGVPAYFCGHHRPDNVVPQRQSVPGARAVGTRGRRPPFQDAVHGARRSGRSDARAGGLGGRLYQDVDLDAKKPAATSRSHSRLRACTTGFHTAELTSGDIRGLSELFKGHARSLAGGCRRWAPKHRGATASWGLPDRLLPGRADGQRHWTPLRALLESCRRARGVVGAARRRSEAEDLGGRHDRTRARHSRLGDP